MELHTSPLAIAERRLLFHTNEELPGNFSEQHESESEQPDDKTIVQREASPKRGNPERTIQERDERKLDAKRAERMLDVVEERSSRDLTQEKSDILREWISRENSKDSFGILVRLIIVLLAQANGAVKNAEMPDLQDAAATRTKGTGVADLSDAAIVRTKDGSPQLRMKGEPYIQDGSLSPEPIVKESAADRFKRWVGISHELAFSTTEKDYRKQQEQSLDECDRELDSGIGAARRDTIEGRRREAQQNLKTLDAIRADRVRKCEEMNASLKESRRKVPNQSKDPFALARYQLSQHLDIVLVGIDAVIPPGESADLSDGHGGMCRVTVEDSSITFEHWHNGGGNTQFLNERNAMNYDGPNGQSLPFFLHDTVILTKTKDGLYRAELDDDTLRELREIAEDEQWLRGAKRKLEMRELGNANERAFAEGIRADTETQRAIQKKRWQREED